MIKNEISGKVGLPDRPPRHVAIIMDGNRRWARQRLLPTTTGHAAGARRVREIVRVCVRSGVQVLTLFAFSTENWRRSSDEVMALMHLFGQLLLRETSALYKAGVRLRVLGNIDALGAELQALIKHAEAATAQGNTITLQVAVNYGGRWDFLQAVKAWQRAHPDQSLQALSEAALAPWLSGGDLPEVDLLIRTGGEQRISNFLLWQAAYAELYFTSVLWPEFRTVHLREAFASFAKRDRRFGSSDAV